MPLGEGLRQLAVSRSLKCNRRGIVAQFENVTRYGHGLRDELCFEKRVSAENLCSLSGSVRRGKGRHPGRVLRQLYYNRKYAIRLLNGPAPSGGPLGKRRRRRGFTYGPRVLSILKAVWETADYPWSVRLKALLPEWMPWIRRRYRLSAETERAAPAADRRVDRRRSTSTDPHRPAQAWASLVPLLKRCLSLEEYSE